ncbi:LamG-like jellyroll fold domain-containing protein [Candidatus Poribacteria bacterium]
MPSVINGVQAVSLNNGGIPIGQTGNQLVIGASPWGKDWPSEGLYDEVKLYNIAFDANQVKTRLMAEGVTKVAVSPRAKAATTWARIKYSQ